MDFLDPKKRRAHKRRLFIGYALMAVLVLGIATLLVFQSFGYSFDPRTGDITQNGLLFVDAHPQPADVVLNGQSRGFTDRRLVLPAGNYTLELKREGYHDWRRDFVLEGGHIERFVYPFLFPVNLETSQTQLYTAEPTFATQSPDRRWLIVQQNNSISQLQVVDINTEIGTASSLAVPDGLFTAAGKKHVLELVEWSTNNRHVVVKHTHDKGSEYVLIDRENPEESVNLSRQFTQPFTSLTLRDKKFDRYYFYNKPTKQLSSATLSATTTQPVLENVLQYRSHGDDVLLYTTPDSGNKDQVLVRVLENEEAYTLRSLPVDERYLLDLARFDGKWYMVAGAASEDRVFVYRDPIDLIKRESKLIPTAVLRVDDPRFVSFSNNARVIAVQSGGKFATYDAETNRLYRYDTEIDAPASRKATWMDGHRLTLVHDGKVNVFDFDDVNERVLSASYNGFYPYFDRDYTALYTLAPAPNIDNRGALLRTELIVEN